MKRAISDKVMVITGASSGIGLVTAKMAAKKGAKVIMAARNEQELESQAEEIRRSGGTAIAVATDVSDFDQVESLANRTIDEFGQIDVWINNAAVAMYGTFKELPLDDFRQLMEINFMGQVHGAKAALPHLEDSKGKLICVGSVLSDRGIPLQGAYCAAKHAIKGWLDSLRVELKAENSPVQVTLIKPASINTPFFAKARTYMGVEPMPVPPIYEPELVAKAILRAVVSNKRDVYVGGGGVLMSVIERINPKLLDFQFRRTGFSGQQTDHRKGLEAPDNLYDPVAVDGGGHGQFGKKSKKRSPFQGYTLRSLATAAGLMTVAATFLVGAGAAAVARTA